MSSWLDESLADSTAMSEVNKAVKKWRELQFKRDQAEELAKLAEKEYQEYCKEFSALLRHNGLEAMKLEDGSEVGVVSKVRCSILKGKQNEVAEWLREHGAENLVSSTLVVMPSAKATLDEMGVAYDEETAMNTNSVKAWVKGEIEVGNVDVTSLPSGLSWYMYDDVYYKEV